MIILLLLVVVAVLIKKRKAKKPVNTTTRVPKREEHKLEHSNTYDQVEDLYYDELDYYETNSGDDILDNVSPDVEYV